MEAKKLTEKEIFFPIIAERGHLYQVFYQDGNIAIVAGYGGRIGKLSINLTNRLNELEENEFFVRMYGEGEIMNDPCFETGLFEKIGEPFKNNPDDFTNVRYQKWRLKG